MYILQNEIEVHVKLFAGGKPDSYIPTYIRSKAFRKQSSAKVEVQLIFKLKSPKFYSACALT